MGVQDLGGRALVPDPIQKADEFLMAMHVPADDHAVDDAHGGEERRRSVADIVVCHGAGSALVERQPRLRAVERLNLALLVEPSNDGVGEGIHRT